MNEIRIATAASQVYADSVVALAASIRANWSRAVPITVYDLGIDAQSKDALSSLDVEIRAVPAFCPHWRKHFTWKLWCWNDLQDGCVFWIDAGVAVLRPMDEVFEFVRSFGYFAIPNYQRLALEASAAAVSASGTNVESLDGKTSIAGGIFGFDSLRLKPLLQEALEIALVEENIRATEPRHRHDQAILSLLLTRDYSPLKLADGRIYAGYAGPEEFPEQKLWVHHGHIPCFMREELLEHVAEKRSGPHVFKFPPGKERSAVSRIVRQCARALKAPVKQWVGQFKREQNEGIYDGVRD